MSSGKEQKCLPNYFLHNYQETCCCALCYTCYKMLTWAPEGSTVKSLGKLGTQNHMYLVSRNLNTSRIHTDCHSFQPQLEAGTNSHFAKMSIVVQKPSN